MCLENCRYDDIPRGMQWRNSPNNCQVLNAKMADEPSHSTILWFAPGEQQDFPWQTANWAQPGKPGNCHAIGIARSILPGKGQMDPRSRSGLHSSQDFLRYGNN